MSILTYIYKNYTDDYDKTDDNILTKNIQCAFMNNIINRFLNMCKSDDNNGKMIAYIYADLYDMSTGLPRNKSEKMVTYEISSVLRKMFPKFIIDSTKETIEKLYLEDNETINSIITPSLITGLFINLVKNAHLYRCKSEEFVSKMYYDSNCFFNLIFNNPEDITEEYIIENLQKFHNDKKLEALTNEPHTILIPKFSPATNSIHGPTVTFCGTCGHNFLKNEEMLDNIEKNKGISKKSVTEDIINEIKKEKAEHFKSVYHSCDSDGKPNGGSINYNLHRVTIDVVKRHYRNPNSNTEMTLTRDIVIEIVKGIIRNDKGNIYEKSLLSDIVLCASNLIQLLNSGHKFSDSEYPLSVDMKIIRELVYIGSNRIKEEERKNFYIDIESLDKDITGEFIKPLTEKELDFVYGK